MSADVQANQRRDRVVLNDGTTVEGLVLVVTCRGVLLVEADAKHPEKQRQRLIPAAEIEQIVRGEFEGSVAGFQTETELARKVIGDGSGQAEHGARPAHRSIRPSQATRPVASPYSSQQLAEAYVQRFPVLKTAAQSLLGAGRVAEALERARQGDPWMRAQVETFLGMFLNAQTVARATARQTNTPGDGPRRQPARRERPAHTPTTPPGEAD